MINLFNKGIELLVVKRLAELTENGKQFPKINRIDNNYVVIDVITITVQKSIKKFENKRVKNVTIFLTKKGERKLRGQKPLKRQKRYITIYGWSYK